MGKNLVFMMVGVAAGFVLASMLQKVEQESSIESSETLIDSLEDKLNKLEKASPALN